MKLYLFSARGIPGAEERLFPTDEEYVNGSALSLFVGRRDS